MGLSKEHDWVMETLYNPTFTNTDFKTVGINTSNTSIAPLDVYLKQPEIQNMPLFQTDGQFDAAKVQQYYYKALRSYNNLAKDTYEQDLDMNLEAIFASNNFFVAPNRRMLGPLVSLTFLDNPTRQTFGVVEINTPGRQYKSVEEIAQTNQIWDSRTNSFTEDTPEDSFFKNFFRPMALAVWEYDADANGNRTNDPSKIVYHLGEMKLHNGEPYYEFLNGKSGYGRLILSKMNVLTKEDSWLNQFDFFDSDDLEKSFAGSVAKNVAKIVPLFIPYVGEAYMYTSLALAGTEALATIGKMFTGSENTILNETTSFLSSLNGGVSEYGKQHAFSMENILNMVGDTFLFIKSLRLLAENAPKWFGAKVLNLEEAAAKVESLALEATNEQMKLMRAPLTEAEEMAAAKALNDIKAVNIDKYRRIILKEIENYQKLGLTISTNYMAITFGTHTYEAAKAEGVEDLPATLLTLGAIAGQYALLNSHIGQWVFPEANVIALLKKKALELFPQFFNKEIIQSMEEGVNKATSTASKITWAEKIWNKGKAFANKVYSTPTQTTALAAITGGIASGVEMTAFSVLDDVIGQVYNTAQWISGNPHRMHPWENMLERYATSFLGGGVAGLMSIPKLKDAAKQIHEMTPELAYRWVVAAVADGKGDDLIKEVDKVKWTTSDLSAEKYVDTPDGERLYQMGTVTDNLDHFIREGVKNEIRLIGRILDAHNAKIGSNALLNNDIRGPLKIAQVQTSSMIKKYVSDYYDTLVKIVHASKELADLPDPVRRMLESDIEKAEKEYKELKKKYEESKSEEDKKELDKAKSNLDNLNTLSTKRNELKDLLDKKNKFLNGEYEAEYKEKALFEMSTGVNAPFINASYFKYVEKLFNKPFSELSGTERIQGIKEYKKVKKDWSDHIQGGWEVFSSVNELASDYLKDIKTRDVSKNLDFKDTKLLKHIVGNVKGDLKTLLKFRTIPDISEIKAAETFYDKTINSIIGELNTSLRGIKPENINPELSNAINDVEILVADLKTKLASVNSDLDNIRNLTDLPRPLTDIIHKDFVNYRGDIENAIRTLEGMLYSGLALSILEKEIDSMKIITPILYTKLYGVVKELANLRPLEDIKTVVRKFDSEFNLNDNILELIPEQFRSSLDILQLELENRDSKYGYININNTYVRILEKLKEIPQFDLIDVLDAFGKKITNGRFSFADTYKLFSDTFITNSKDLELYLIGLSDLNNSEIALHVLRAFRSTVIASNDVVRELDDIFGYNPTVNSLRGTNDLAVLPESDVVFLADHINLLEEQLSFFEKIAYAAGASKFRDIIKVDNDVVFNFYKTLSTKFENIPDSWNGKLELLADIKNIEVLPDLVNAGSRDLTTEQYIQAFKGLIKFESAIHSFALKNLDKVRNIDTLSEFLEIFDCFKEEIKNGKKLKTEAIGDKPDFIDENAMMYYVASLFAIDPEIFYSNLKATISDIESVRAKKSGNNNPLALTIVQLLGAKTAFAYVEDNEIFKCFAKAYNKKIGETTGQVDSIFHTSFDNIFLIEAGAGAGKSSGILSLFISTLRLVDKNKLKNIWFASTQPKDNSTDNTSAKNIRDNTGIAEDESSVFTKQQLMEHLCDNYNVTLTENNILKLNPEDINYNEDTWIATYSKIKLKEDFDVSTLPKLIVIDECSDYSDLDFRIISDFAKKYGVKVLILGDFEQTGLKGKYNLTDGKIYQLGLERTLFARTFLNHTSFRTNNILLDYNFMLDRTQLLPSVYGSDALISYKFFTDDSGLYGRYIDKNINILLETKDNVDLMLRTLGENEKVGFVYDSEEGELYKYVQSLPNELLSKVEFHKYQPIKGVEAKYYIVELDAEVDDAEAFSHIKSVLHTAFTRAIQGNILHIPEGLGTVQFSSDRQLSNGLLRSPTEAIVTYSSQLKEFLDTLYSKPKTLTTPEVNLPKNAPSENGGAQNNGTDNDDKDDSKDDGAKDDKKADPIINSDDDSNIGNVFNAITPGDLDKSVNKLNDSPRQINANRKAGSKITLYKIGGGKESEIPDVELEEFIWELYTSFNNYTGLIEDPNLGFKESRQSSKRFDNYYGLRNLIEMYDGNVKWLLSDKTSDKNLNLDIKALVTDLMLLLRELIWYTKDFDTLENSLKTVLKSRLGLKKDFNDFYIRFMWESSYHRNDSDGEGPLHRSYEEKLDGIHGSAKNKDKISAKGLALHIGAKVTDSEGEHDTVMMSIPFANLPNPYTILGLLILKAKTPEGKKYKWAEKYGTPEFNLAPDPYSKLCEIMIDLESQIRLKATNKNYKIEPGQVTLYYLIRAYIFNRDAYAPIVRNGSKELFDPKWTPAKYLNTTSPYIISSERGVNYEYAEPRGFIDLTVNKGKVEYITVEELQSNPTLSVSNIYITTNDVLDSKGNIKVKKGDPFVLVGSKKDLNGNDFLEDTLIEHFNNLLQNQDTPNMVSVVYVRLPRAPLTDYLDLIKNLTIGKTPKDRIFIGNDFTSYRILQLLSTKQSNGKSIIEEVYEAIPFLKQKDRLKKYIDTFDKFINTLKEELGNAGLTIGSLDTYDRKATEAEKEAAAKAFKIAANLLREPSGFSTKNSSLHYSQILNNLVLGILRPKYLQVNYQVSETNELALHERMYKYLGEAWKARYGDEDIPYNINFNSEVSVGLLGKVGALIPIYSVTVDSTTKHTFAGKPYMVPIVRTPILEGNIFPLIASIGFTINNGGNDSVKNGPSLLVRGASGNYYVPLNSSGLSKKTGPKPEDWGVIDLKRDGIRMSKSLKNEGASKKKASPTKDKSKEYSIPKDLLDKLSLDDEAPLSEVISKANQEGYISIKKSDGVTYFINNKAPGYSNHSIQFLELIDSDTVVVTFREKVDDPTITKVTVKVDFDSGKASIKNLEVIRKPEPIKTGEALSVEEVNKLKGTFSNFGLNLETWAMLEESKLGNLKKVLSKKGLSDEVFNLFLKYRLERQELDKMFDKIHKKDPDCEVPF